MEDGRGSGVPELTTSMRVERPDGTVLEVVREGSGRFATSWYGADGELSRRLSGDHLDSGDVAVTESGPGSEPVSFAPRSVTRELNPYGLTVERLQYGDGIAVERCFDDDVRLCRVVVRAPWGHQELEVHADGSRSMSWGTALHHGNQSWDAAGDLDRWEVRFTDGTTARSPALR
jgi:hypothetical protein